MVTKERIAIIPARGGSKRIPRKNIVDFFGKPMIAWTIEAARNSGLFDYVLVSTDDAEIAAIGRDWGAEVPFLRDCYADDRAPSSRATLRALEQVRETLDTDFRIVAQLMPNCPLRGSADILESHARFSDRGAPFQLSCFRFNWANPWWAARLDESGYPRPLFPEALKRRSQDLDPLYCPSGAIWLAEVAALRRADTFYGPGHVYCPIRWQAAVDVDDEDDLAMARATYRLLHDGTGHG